MKRSNYFLFLRIIILILFLALTIIIYLKYGRQIIDFITSPEKTEEFFNQSGVFGFFAFFLLQILQVIIAMFPGEITQFASGYIYGIWLGTLISLAGIFIGTIAVFYISRFLGYPVLKNLLDPDRLKKWHEVLQNGKAGWVIFVLFLIPGSPKSFLTYAAGISPISWYTFFPLAMLGRLPGIFISSIIGANVYEGNYRQAGFVAIIVTILFFLALSYRKQIISAIK